MTLRRLLVAALAAALSLVAGPAMAEVKVALVIGNAAYPAAPLRNPVNDANAIAARLKALGFDVTLRTNVTQREMTRAVSQFGQALKPGSIGLFYYAGHGMQVRGRNFLVPVDADIQSEASARSESVDLDLVLEQLGPARLSMVILDACRNNPFEGRFRSQRGSGLAQVDAPKGTLLAYATAPGKVASDGDGANGLYTAELLKAMDTPGAKVEEVFKAVRVNVIKATAGEQIPWESSSLTGDYYFRPAAANGNAAAARETKASQAEIQSKLDAERKARENEAAILKSEMEKLREEVRRLSAATTAPAAKETAKSAEISKTSEPVKPAERKTAETVAAAPATAPAPMPQPAKPASNGQAPPGPKVATPAPARPAAPPTSGQASAPAQARPEIASAAPPPGMQPKRLALEEEWKRRFGMVEGQHGKLTLSKAFALLLGPFSDEQLLAMVTRERELRDLPYSSAFALGITEKGFISRGWAWGERSPFVASETAVNACSRFTRNKCNVVVVNGEFREAAFLEWAHHAAGRPPAEVRADLLKQRPVTR